MRVLHLIETLEFGGAEKVLIDLANEMSARHDVTVCCVKRLGELSASLNPRIRVLCLDKGEGNDIRLPFRLARLLRRERIEALHVHNWGVYLEGALAGLIARVPVLVHTVHGPYTSYSPVWQSRVKCAVRHWIERRLAPFFSKIVTVSDSIQHYIRDEIGIDGARLMTIHNGIRIGGAPGRKTAGGNIVFTTVGRFAAIKNHAMMIRAFHQANAPDSCLWLVGDGPERGHLEALVQELGLDGRVVFTGFRQDVVDILAKTDVFLMSSDYEGISIAVLEAMRSGLPVIGTRVGGMAETVQEGETGILVGKGDVEAMARAIRTLIASPDERVRLGERARRFLEAEFSITTMVERYERLYMGEDA